MVRLLEKCCTCREEQSQVWPRSASTSWPYRASQMELATGPSHSLHAFTQSSWPVQQQARPWDDAYHGWWDDAAQGNSAQQSGLLGRIYEEVAPLNGQPSVCLFFVLQKFYDSVCLHTLIGRNLPKRLLHTAMQTYLTERMTSAGEIVEQRMQPTNRIQAGSSLGNRFAQLVLDNILECVNNTFPAQLSAPVETPVRG